MAYLTEEIKAGVIIVAAFLILGSSVIFIGGSQFFEKLDSYTVRVYNAAGIEEGAQVRLGGVKIGKVLAVIPPGSPGDPVTITMGVTKGTVLYKGTRAAISQVGLMGDLYILLAIDAIDRANREQFRPGDTIPMEEQVPLAVTMARIDRISRSVEGVVKDIGLIFSDKNIKEIGAILKNVNSTIISGSANLDQVAAALKGTTVKLELVLNEVELLAKDTRAEVPPLVKKARDGIEKAESMIVAIEESAKAAHTTIKNADKTIDRQSLNMDVLLHTLNRATEDLRDALHEIRSKPWGLIYQEEQGKGE